MLCVILLMLVGIRILCMLFVFCLMVIVGLIWYRFWSGCFRGVLVWLCFVGVVWIFFSLVSMCFVGRSGGCSLFLLLFGLSRNFWIRFYFSVYLGFFRNLEIVLGSFVCVCLVMGMRLRVRLGGLKLV